MSSAWLYDGHQSQSFDSNDVEGSTNVQYKSWQSFAIHIIRNNQEWTIALGEA